MSLRLIAIDLYRLVKEVEELEKKIEDAPFEKKEALKYQLYKLKAERDRMKSMLEAKKDRPPYSKLYK